LRFSGGGWEDLARTFAGSFTGGICWQAKSKDEQSCQRRKSLIRSLQKHHASTLGAAQTDARCDRVVSGGGSTFCMEPIMPALKMPEMSERLFT
jgi:hypothetical protein